MLRSIRSSMSVLLFLIIVSVIGFSKAAGAISLDWQVPGDGKTPTFAQQYLDGARREVKPAAHLASASIHGDAMYGYDFALPPAILKPTLGLSYSSNAVWSTEFAAGWSFTGLLEIRRPLERYFAASSQRRLSGPEFGGMLLENSSASIGAEYALRTANAAYVTADYDEGTNTWSVYANGLTHTLSAEDAGSTSTSGTALWRVTRTQDAKGNYISYVYKTDDSGRLDAVYYGGNTTTGDSHNVKIAVSYGANTSTRTSAQNGFLQEYRYHVEAVTISTRIGSGAWTRVNAYDLVYTTTDLVNLLTSLEYEGASASTTQIVGEYEYTAFDGTSRGSSVDGAPYAISVSKSHIDAYSGSPYSETEVTDALVDYNGDSLPDVIEVVESGAEDVWYVHGQQVSSTDELSFMTTPEVVERVTGYDTRNALNKVVSEQGVHTARPDYLFTKKMIADLDGDGYLDQISCDNTESWSVRYGTGGGQLESEIEESASGFSYCQTAYAADVDNYPGEDGDLLEGLAMDFNGDGWMDLYDADDGLIFFHTTDRGGGWNGIEDMDIDFAGALRRVNYTTAVDTNDIDYSDYISSCENECGSAEDECLHDGDIDGEGCYYNSGYDCNASCFDYLELETDYPDCTSTCEDCVDACDGNSDCEDACANDAGSCDDMCLDAHQDIYDDCVADCESCENECGDALSECEAECNDIDTSHVRYITNTDVKFEFVDLNGDTLPDGVDASMTPWRVSLNTGYEFLDAVSWTSPLPYTTRIDEGYPNVDYESSDLGVRGNFSGAAARVYQKLIDIDGDGLLDLAVHTETGAVWYKNKGNGFEYTTSRTLPSFLPGDFTISRTDSDMDLDNGKTESTTTTTSSVLDVDHDGALDYVIPGMEVAYGTYPRPYLLKKIKNHQGGETALGYKSSGVLPPAGDFNSEQKLPIHKNVVETVTTTDTLTGENAQTKYNYGSGAYEEQMFQGFENRYEYKSIDDRDSSFVMQSYELSYLYPPLMTWQRLDTDANLTFGSTIARGDGTVSLQTRYETTNTYEDYNSDIGAFLYRFLSTSSTTESGESSGSKTIQLRYGWDDYANLTSYSHDGGGVEADIIAVLMAYNQSEDGRFYRLRSKSVSGVDPLSGDEASLVEFEQTRYLYDNKASYEDAPTDGFLTSVQTLSGYRDGGESLEASSMQVSYGRGPRGETSSVTDEETGYSVSYTYGFSDAVVATLTNSLGHVLTNTIDSRGRPTQVQDGNGYALGKSFDDLGHVTDEYVVDTAGASLMFRHHVYNYATAPYATQTQDYNSSGTAVESTSYIVEDGFGNALQRYIQDYAGTSRASNTLTDATGNVLATGHPVAGVYPTASATIVSTLGRYYYDAFGNLRESVNDEAKGTGASLVYLDQPWQEVRQDESGYRTRLTFDAHHRILKVEQGKQDAYATTAEYRYDPLHRLAKFTDPRGNVTTYSYDGAGRLREVKWGVATALSTWVTYGYDGRWLTDMTDATGRGVHYNYDAIGRRTTTTAYDPLNSPTYETTYTTAYDTQWEGQKDSEADASGTTAYTYDAFGNVDTVTRSYGTISPITFNYDFDARERLTKKVLPSGYQISNAYAYGWLTSQSGANASNTTEFTVDYTYNQWGKLNTATSSLGHTFTNTYTTPLWPDQFKLQYGVTTYKRDYAWYGNGLMQSKTHATATSYVYTYDDLKQITAVRNGATSIEGYAYDAAGNLTSMSKGSQSWTYAAAGTHNQIVSRSGTTNDTYEYDAAGRMTKWKTGATTRTYGYDGFGRLRYVKNGVSYREVLDYDVNGKAVRRADGNPFTTTPNYTYTYLDWRYDPATSTTKEHYTGLVSNDNGTRKWFFKELDGHVAQVVGDTGTNIGSRTDGIYGLELATTGTTWAENAYHGVEKEGGNELYAMGQRHLTQKDGQWLQPEPLLYLGIPQKMLATPLALSTYRYAMNSPMSLTDTTGFAPSDPTDGDEKTDDDDTWDSENPNWNNEVTEETGMSDQEWLNIMKGRLQNGAGLSQQEKDILTIVLGGYGNKVIGAKPRPYGRPSPQVPAGWNDPTHVITPEERGAVEGVLGPAEAPSFFDSARETMGQALEGAASYARDTSAGITRYISSIPPMDLAIGGGVVIVGGILIGGASVQPEVAAAGVGGGAVLFITAGVNAMQEPPASYRDVQ